MKIADGTHRIDGINGNVYLVEDGENLTLIDTGLPRNDKKILKYIESIGRKSNDVKTIVLTHFHIDHVGSLKKIKEATGAKVAAHEVEAEIISSKKTAPKPKNLMIKALTAVIKADPVDVELPLKDNDKVGRLTVVYTPGHSEGSISLLDAERRVIFVGDTVRFNGDKIEGPPERFTLDPQKAKDSIGHLASFDFDILLSGHGEPLMPNASGRLKEFYATQK
jgi:glyoxylase-like metal-dependent hydrolase (beta-lactamase superfamily II)